MPNEPNKLWSGRSREPLNRPIPPAPVLFSLLLQGCKGKPEETRTEVRNGDYKIVLRTQQFHHSGILNTDVCVAHEADTEFPTKQLQCFLHGFDFSDLKATWRSPTAIILSFRCGEITSFRNSADVYDMDPAPQELYAFLNDTCTLHDRFGETKQQ